MQRISAAKVTMHRPPSWISRWIMAWPANVKSPPVFGLEAEA